MTGVQTCALPISALLQDVSAGFAKVCNSEYPAGWFGVNLDLTLEESDVYAKVFDSFGNPSEFSDKVTVIYDTTPPTVTNFFPATGLKTASNITTVGLTFVDRSEEHTSELQSH